MMGNAIKGPGIFLAQFAGNDAPFDSLPAITAWAAGLGYKGVQIPSWDRRLFDLDLCAESQTYADEVLGICAEAGVAITELSTHLQGQLIAVNPAYDAAFDAFAPETVRGNPAARQAWGGGSGDQRPQRRHGVWGFRERSASPDRWPSPTSTLGPSAPRDW